MNILMILDGEFPPDDRVEKEALSLIGDGNRVSLMCLNYGSQKEIEVYKGISIIRLRINKTLRNKIMATYLVLPFYRYFWRKSILNFIRNNKTDVIHIHDLPLSDIGIELKKTHGFHIVCDQHEYYSNWIVNTAHYNTAIGKIVKHLSNWKAYEMKNLPLADLVITVEEPLRSIYLSETLIKPEKIIVLPNTPLASLFNASMKDENIIKKYSKNFVIFYAGHLDILRGINTIIESLPLLRNHIPDIKFVFAGDFTAKYYNPLKTIEKLGVEDLTEYLGFIPIKELPSYIAASRVCVFIPPAISREINNTIATKIYQYLLMNKPIIVGQAGMMKDFVEKHRIGLSIKESDPQDFAEKIRLLHSNPSLIAEFEENTKKIAMNYSWEETSKVFLKSYQSLKT
jgi:glycosyltransferase involved in cell wall biosynthesis